MYRIDNPTAIPYLPALPPSAAPGFFTDGNPAAALEATVVDAWWLNQLQEEILTVTGAAGIAPDRGRHTQLFEALDALYQRNGVIGNYLPLAGGTMNGFLTLHANPTLEMHAATKLYVDQVMGGIVIPPVGDYLPLTGGTLYRPGGADILGMDVDEGHEARMLFNVRNTRMWGVGARPDGLFEIGDWNIGGARLTIDEDGRVSIFQDLWVGGAFNAASGDIPGSLVVGGDLHLPSGGNIFAGGGALFAGRAEIVYGLTAGSDIAASGSLRGWAVLVQSDVIAGGTLTSQGAVISGLMHSDAILTNAAATINGAATIGGVLRANGNRILSYGGNNPSVAMVNLGAAPGFCLSVGGNPGRLAIGTADTNGNPSGTNFLTLDSAGTLTNPGTVVTGNLAVNAAATIAYGLTVGQGIVVSAGGANIYNGLTVSTGPATLYNGLVVSAGGVNINAGLIVNSGGATIAGSVSVSQNLGVGGLSDLTGALNVYANPANKPGGGEWGSLASDIRVKRDIASYNAGLTAIRALRPVTWRYNGLGEVPDTGELYHGLIAQEVAEIMPEMIGHRAVKLREADAEPTELLTLDCTALKFALVNAIKELAERLEELETRRTT